MKACREAESGWGVGCLPSAERNQSPNPGQYCDAATAWLSLRAKSPCCAEDALHLLVLLLRRRDLCLK